MSSTDAEAKTTEQDKPKHGGYRNKEEVLLRQSKALMLKVQHGMSDTEIAKELGYTDASGARKSWQAALSRVDAANAGELREVVGMRIERQYRNLVPTLEDAPHTWDMEEMNPRTLEVKSNHFFNANNVALKCAKQYAQLYGLEAPVKVEVEDVTPERDSILEKLNTWAEGYDAAKGEKAQVSGSAAEFDATP